MDGCGFPLESPKGVASYPHELGHVGRGWSKCPLALAVWVATPRPQHKGQGLVTRVDNLSQALGVSTLKRIHFEIQPGYLWISNCQEFGIASARGEMLRDSLMEQGCSLVFHVVIYFGVEGLYAKSG